MRGAQTTWAPQVFAIAALLWALNPGNPYGYYIFLRWLCFCVFAYVAYLALERDQQNWVWLAGCTAVVYNPFIRVHLTRDVWSVVNVVTAVLALASIWALRPREARKVGPNDIAHDVHPKTPARENARATAEGLMEAGKLREAELFLRAALVRDPKDHWVISLLGKCLDRLSDTAAAVAFYREIASSPEKHGALPRPFALRRITQLEPNDLTAWDQLAAFHEASGHEAFALGALMPLADGLERAGRTDDRALVLSRIEAMYEKASKNKWLTTDTSPGAQRRRETIRAATRYAAEQRKAAQGLRAKRIQEALQHVPLASIEAELTSFRGDVGLVRVPSVYLAQVLERIRLVQEAHGDLPRELEDGATENPHEAPGSFDPTLLLAAFSSVRLKPGYVLDFVYRRTYHEASPLLYSRHTSDAPLRSVAEFAARYSVRVSGFAPNYPSAFADAVAFDNSPIGAAEFAIFLNEAPYFYWVWHAAYERHSLIVDPTDVPDLSSFDAEGSGRVLSQDSGARVRWADGVAWVEMLTRGHDCYALSTWRIQPPNRILECEHTEIARKSVITLY